MFECDIKLSLDGVPFLLHDDTLVRNGYLAGNFNFCRPAFQPRKPSPLVERLLRVRWAEECPNWTSKGNDFFRELNRDSWRAATVGFSRAGDPDHCFGRFWHRTVAFSRRLQACALAYSRAVGSLRGSLFVFRRVTSQPKHASHIDRGIALCAVR